MDWLVAVLYGIVQGLTEFLPVSSSGHLAIIPHFLGIEDPGVHFDLMMHLGTTFALLIYFGPRLWRLSLLLGDALLFWRPIKEEKHSHEIYYLRNGIISTFATLLLIFPLAKFLYIRSTLWIALNLIIFGVLLWLADLFGPNKLSEEMQMQKKVDWKRAITIGLAQALAIIPGVSRSGITLMSGRFLGLSRFEITEYTFFLSIPIILMGCCAKAVESLTILVVNQDQAVHQIDLLPWILGVLCSCIVGLLTIHYFLKLVRYIPFSYFMIYRIILAGLILWHL